MVKVLFCDADPLVLRGLERLLGSTDLPVEAEFFTDGKQALHRAEQGGVDAVVTDLALPDLDGLDLLRRLQADHPTVVRVLLTADMESAEVVDAAGVCQRFLDKPCDPDRLTDVVRTIDRIRDQRGSDRSLSLVGGIDSLPTPPDACLRLCMLLDAEDSTIDDAADTVATDPALTARVLQVANSPFFGLSTSVDDVRTAAGFLGMAAIAGLAVAEGVSAAFPPKGAFDLKFVNDLRDRSTLAAWLSRRIAREIGRPDLAGDAYTSTLLADVGLVVLVSRAAEPMEHVLSIVARQGTALSTVEDDELGFTHAQVGSDMLALWGLSDRIVSAIESHHTEPSEPKMELASIVHCATGIVDEESGLPTEGATSGWVARMGVADRMQAWRDAVAAELSAQRA